MANEVGRAPFVTRSEFVYDRTYKREVTLIFMDDGSIRWEVPTEPDDWGDVPTADWYFE